MTTNEKDSVCYAQPKTTDQRIAIAKDFVRRFGFRIPMLVDDMNNTADKIYAGWPERIYIIDESAKVAYKGKLGPDGYDPTELERWLQKFVSKSREPSHPK